MATKKTSTLELAANKIDTKKNLEKPQKSKLLIEKTARKGPRTRVVVRFDVGFDNFLTIRGKGANLNWEKGTRLQNMKPDEWMWETDASFNTCEFKILINDSQFEIGENHPISCGASIQYAPKF